MRSSSEMVSWYLPRRCNHSRNLTLAALFNSRDRSELFEIEGRLQIYRSTV